MSGIDVLAEMAALIAQEEELNRRGITIAHRSTFPKCPDAPRKKQPTKRRRPDDHFLRMENGEFAKRIRLIDTGVKMLT
jgi:hypothetical protein